MNLPEQPEVHGDAAKVLRWINTILIAGGGLMAVAVWNGVEAGRMENKQAVSVLESKFTALDKEMAKTEANRYTSGDHIQFSASVATQFNTYDKRVTRLEDGMTTIKDGQNAMQRTLDVIKASVEKAHQN